MDHFTAFRVLGVFMEQLWRSLITADACEGGSRCWNVVLMPVRSGPMLWKNMFILHLIIIRFAHHALLCIINKYWQIKIVCRRCFL